MYTYHILAEDNVVMGGKISTYTMIISLFELNAIYVHTCTTQLCTFHVNGLFHCELCMYSCTYLNTCTCMFHVRVHGNVHILMLLCVYLNHISAGKFGKKVAAS